MRQLLPTTVASLGNQIIELITWVWWINGSVRDFLRTLKESNFLQTVHYFNSLQHRTKKEQTNRVKLVRTLILRQNLHTIDITVSFHRIKFTNVELCEASNVFKHVQTSVHRRSSSKFLYLRYYYYLRRMKLVEMIENRIRIDEQTQSNTYSLTFFDKFTVPSILRHRFHRHRMKLMEAEEGNDGGERSRQLSNVRTSS